MADLGLMEAFWAKSPEELRNRLVEALLDESREFQMEARRQLAELLQHGRGGYVATISRAKAARPTTDTARNVAIYHAINEARYRKRVDGDFSQHIEWREKAALSADEWAITVQGVIEAHNANCEPDDRWNPLRDHKAVEKAFARGYEAATDYQRVQEETNSDN